MCELRGAPRGLRSPGHPGLLSPQPQAWAAEASGRCTRLLSSRDGGILTVSLPQRSPGSASLCRHAGGLGWSPQPGPIFPRVYEPKLRIPFR